jgi:hypothetical protein
MKTSDIPHRAEDLTVTSGLAGRALDDISTTVEHEAEQVPEAGKYELPHRSGEPRFAPRAYYYAASRSGVVPSWVASAH